MAKVRSRPGESAARTGFSLLELLIAVVVIAVIAAIGIPMYRGYVATARDGVMVNQMTSMSVFQEDTRMRTGAYGAGDYDAAKGITTLEDAIGWAPSGDDGIVFSVTASGTSWTVTATDASGRVLCRVFPAGDPCS